MLGNPHPLEGDLGDRVRKELRRCQPETGAEGGQLQPGCISSRVREGCLLQFGIRSARETLRY